MPGLVCSVAVDPVFVALIDADAAADADCEGDAEARARLDDESVVAMIDSRSACAHFRKKGPNACAHSLAVHPEDLPLRGDVVTIMHLEGQLAFADLGTSCPGPLEVKSKSFRWRSTAS